MTLLPRLNVVFDFSDPPEFNSAARGSIFKHDNNDKTSKKEQGEQDETVGLNASDGRSAKTKKNRNFPLFFSFAIFAPRAGPCTSLSLSLSSSSESTEQQPPDDTK